ncbi:MAG: DNA primase [candidate division WOR-3 bacterium]|nr:DNA primase [candidate division WOR-3 bacterium]
MSISDEVTRQIKDKIEIVDLIEDYLPLKKVGKNYRTNCPFHKDDTPSFYVSPDLNIFHCFGCGKSGDIITFIMEYEKVSFPEAVRILANKAGIEIGGFGGENKILYTIHKFATDFYHKRLLNSPRVLDYLGKRGIESETIKEFKLGFAPSGNNFLPEAKKKFKVDDLMRSGLVKESKGNIKDHFFLRLLFPLFSPSGRVIGFGGRRLSKKGPKYLNSPDTPIHKKGKNLYSLWHTKEEIRKLKTVILVEGYFDFLSIYQAGIKNAVACLGTSLTGDQAQLLSRYADEVVIFFDRDAAGRKATLRSLGMLLNEGVDVKIGKPETGKDPDEIIHTRGIEKFKGLLEESSDFVDWTLNRIRDEYDLSSPMGLSRAVEEVSSILSQIREPTRYEIYKEAISRKLAVRQDLLEVKKTPRNLEVRQKMHEIPERDEFELSFIYAMIEKPEERESVFSILNEEDIENPHLKKWFRLMRENKVVSIEEVIESLPKNLMDYVIRESEKPAISATLSAINLKKYSLDKLIERKRLELQRVEEKGDEEVGLLREIRDLIDERRELKEGEIIGN